MPADLRFNRIAGDAANQATSRQPGTSIHIHAGCGRATRLTTPPMRLSTPMMRAIARGLSELNRAATRPSEEGLSEMRGQHDHDRAPNVRLVDTTPVFADAAGPSVPDVGEGHVRAGLTLEGRVASLAGSSASDL